MSRRFHSFVDICLPFLALSTIVIGCRPTPKEEKIVLRVANWGGAKEGNKYDQQVADLYREFERANPGVTIREENVPGDEYVPKMTLAFIAKAEPDVLMLDASSAAFFIDNQMVEDLSPRIAADRGFRLDDYFPNVMDIARRGSALYAIPQDFTPMVMYYNRRLFDAAHLPYPSGNWTFDNFRHLAKRLTIPAPAPDAPAKQYGFAFANWPPGWVMWLWNAGADHMSPDGKRAQGYLDSPASALAVSFLRDLIAVDRSSPSLGQAAAMGVDPFVNGQAAMTVSGHWSMIDYGNAPKDASGKPKIAWNDLGVVPLPHNTPKSQTVMYESGYALGRHGAHKDLAWKFIKYMTSRKVQEVYQSSGIAVCARRDVAEARSRLSRLERAFLPIIPTSRAPYGARIEGYAFVEEQMRKAMDGVLQSGKSPQDALHTAASKIDREFSKQ